MNIIKTGLLMGVQIGTVFEPNSYAGQPGGFTYVYSESLVREIVSQYVQYPSTYFGESGNIKSNEDQFITACGGR